MVFVILVDPTLLLDPTESVFWGVEYCDNCEIIVVNLFLDLKVSFVIRARAELYKYHDNDVLLQVTWTPSRSNCGGS